MAKVTVCDSCGAPILETGYRVLVKREGTETAAADLCEKCGLDFIQNAKQQSLNLEPKEKAESK